MLQGAWTAEAARVISNQFDSQGFDVLCPHQDKRTGRNGDSHVRNGHIISWVGNDLSLESQLAFPDIAVVDRTTRKVVLLCEVEESEPQPKTVVGDILANLLGDHLTFAPNRNELLIGGWTTFSFLAKSTGKGYGIQQLRMLQQKLNQIRMNLATPNAAIKEIIIETYQVETELQERLIRQTKSVVNRFRNQL